MSTTDLIQALRAEIAEGLEKQLLDRLTPIIEKRLYGNIFDIKEATKYLGVSESTLRRMVADREVPFFVQRGQYFFRQTDIDRWIDRQVAENMREVNTR
ncbi:helix-turn-helix domain-containing protein [Paenibacillus alkalitolerans]|uniref:helix-turn-helix domain-containing protein n=1 Tax=Paenibacillus alkalitolerans TaxID=2799335 RepID=UPI0018F5CDF7|nr:helix-turn-helix domain-containing protein [Paenibacillus alkalitolerans]